MKIKYIIPLITLSFYSFGQNTGLYGNRNYIEINTTSNVPLFAAFLTETTYYKQSGAGNSLLPGKNWFDYGLHAVIGRAGKKNVGVSLEFGYDKQNIAYPYYVSKEDNSGWYYYLNIRHEMLNVNTISIMPRIEFTQQGGSLPVGLSHQIGLGLSFSRIEDKEYVYKLEDGYSEPTNPEEFENGLMNKDVSYKGYILMYAFNIKTPVSKQLMINYGIRYTLNLRNYFQVHRSNDDYYFHEYDIASAIGRMRLLNFLTFNLGLTYTF